MMRIARWMLDSETARRRARVDRRLGFLETLSLFPFEPHPTDHWADRTLLDIQPPLKTCPYCRSDADDWGCMKCGIVFGEWEGMTGRATVAQNPKRNQTRATGRGWIFGFSVFSVGFMTALAALGAASIFEFVSDMQSVPSHEPARQSVSSSAGEVLAPAEIRPVAAIVAVTSSNTTSSHAPSGSVLSASMPIYIQRPVPAPYPAHGWSAQLMQYYATGDARFLPPCR